MPATSKIISPKKKKKIKKSFVNIKSVRLGNTSLKSQLPHHIINLHDMYEIKQKNKKMNIGLKDSYPVTRSFFNNYLIFKYIFL